MWNIQILDTDIYHLVAAFVLYSMLGWLVESIYMSFCERKLTNRGFAKSPFCPIYGFGAVCGYYALRPLNFNPVLLYFTGAIVATVFEFLVGQLMLKLFGELWWDYNEKPFNYKGILCLESTVAWGFYALGIVYWLHGKVFWLIDRIAVKAGIIVICVILGIVFVDYVFQLRKAFSNAKEKETIKATVKAE